jgi:hypothetical protein
MVKVLKSLIVAILVVALGVGGLMATGGRYDAYKQAWGDARWQTKLNNFIDAVGADYDTLAADVLAQVNALQNTVVSNYNNLEAEILSRYN